MHNKRKCNRGFVSGILLELILAAVCRTDCSGMVDFLLACYDDISVQSNDLTCADPADKREPSSSTLHCMSPNTRHGYLDFCSSIAELAMCPPSRL